MAFPRKSICNFVFFVMMLSSFVGSLGEFYKVGDKVAWTPNHNVNYSAWASSKTFKTGDVLGFTYNKEHHNVIQVTRDDYHSCNTSSPLATFASGNDHIPIIWKGHYFYISAGKNDCARGQKINVRVVVEGERGNIYQVGDGEALFGSSNVNYSAWVSSKNFKVGDILVFRYNNEAQSVIQVSKEDYHKCNTSSPRATFNSGNDHIPIMHYGHYFYTSSDSTRCAAGQKVDIRVPYPPALMLGNKPLPVSLVSAPAPAPARSGTYKKKGLGLAVALVAIAVAI